MTLTGLWLRLEIGRRWRSLLVLALLTAIGSGVVLTAAAGARRGDTAVGRLAAQTRPATVQVLPQGKKLDWDAVRGWPEVAAVSTFADSAGFRIDGVSFPYAAGNPPADALGTNGGERPIVLQGRLPDPARADEATVSPLFVAKYGFGVGDTVTARLRSPAQVRQAAVGNPMPDHPAGPVLQIRIVGVIRSPSFSDGENAQGSFYASPGLYARYPRNLTVPGASLGGLVRLKHGDADLLRFQDDLAAATGVGGTVVRQLSEFTQSRQRSASFEASCMLALAVAAAIASALLVGQAAARHVAGTVEGLRPLQALGLTPRQAMVLATAGVLPAVLLGGGAGLVVAAVASIWFPVGSAAAFEPDPGFRPDPLVLGVGLVATVVLVLAVAAASAGRELSRPLTGGDGAGRRSGTAALAVRLGLSVPVVTGARFALEPGRGRTAVPSRPALVGAVVGVAGVVAGFTLVAGADDATTHRARFGETWQVAEQLAFEGQQPPAAGQVLARTVADPDVAAVDDARVATAQLGAAGIATTTFSLNAAKGRLPIVLTAGTVPAGPDQIVLAPRTAEAVGAGLGDRVPVRGNGAHGGRSATMTVSGIGFVPAFNDNDYSKGAWVSAAGFSSVFARSDYRIALIQVRPGADPGQVSDHLDAVAGTIKGADGIGAEATSAEYFPASAEVGRVNRLPWALAAFLAVLAVVAVGHALFTAARRRRRDLAVLRALGLTRRQLRAVVATQATVLAVVGVAFGLPLGLALGRTLWRVVADFMPLAYRPPLPLTALLLAAPAALLLANLLAAWPAQRTARLRVAEILRTE